MSEILIAVQTVAQTLALIVVLVTLVCLLATVGMLSRYLREIMADIRAALAERPAPTVLTTNTPAVEAMPASQPIKWPAGKPMVQTTAADPPPVTCPHCDKDFIADPISGELRGDKTVLTHLCPHCGKRFQLTVKT